MDFSEKIKFSLQELFGENKVRLHVYEDGTKSIEWIDDILESSYEWDFNEHSLLNTPGYFQDIVNKTKSKK